MLIVKFEKKEKIKEKEQYTRQEEAGKAETLKRVQWSTRTTRVVH